MAAPIKTFKQRLLETTPMQRVAMAVVAVLGVASIVLFFAFERQIFAILEPAVTYIRTSNVGMVILGCMLFATCIFPLFGYGVVTFICGYVYGIPKGFIPAFVGDILGASAGFWIYRLALHKYIRNKFGDNIEFQEISKAVSKDGFFILFLIRLSSFPFAVLNAYFGAMTELSYWRFILATILSTPRLFIPLFIGQNISDIADPTITGRDRTIKWASNMAGVVIALAVGWYLYRHTLQRIHQINAEQAAIQQGQFELQQGQFYHGQPPHPGYQHDIYAPAPYHGQSYNYAPPGQYAPPQGHYVDTYLAPHQQGHPIGEGYVRSSPPSHSRL